VLLYFISTVASKASSADEYFGAAGDVQLPDPTLPPQQLGLQPYAQKSAENAELSPVERFIASAPTKVHNIPIKAEHGLELYQHWIDQALSSLIACVANRKLKNLRIEGAKGEDKAKKRFTAVEEEEFGECSKSATSVPLHAKCVSRLLRDEISGKGKKRSESLLLTC